MDTSSTDGVSDDEAAIISAFCSIVGTPTGICLALEAFIVAFTNPLDAPIREEALAQIQRVFTPLVAAINPVFEELSSSNGVPVAAVMVATAIIALRTISSAAAQAETLLSAQDQ